jgi:hypothetical protein
VGTRARAAPDYKFPVKIEFVGEIDKGVIDDYLMCSGETTHDEVKLRNFNGETHALVYTDGRIALTMYECCYSLWSLRNGSLLGEHLWYKKKDFRLSQMSIDKIMKGHANE